MFREKVKKMLPIMQAFADGKDVQVAVRGGIWISVNNFTFFGSPENYRIKPVPTYRPYNREECEALGGDPGRTTELDSAEIFFTQSEANRKLVKCRKYRPFKNAEIVRVKIVKAD